MKLLRGIHREFIAACSPRAAESQETVHLRDAFVYTGEAPFRGLGIVRMILCWDNRRAPKRHTLAAGSENSLRESMGIVCTSLKFKTWRFLRGVAVLLLCLGFSLTLLSLPTRGSQEDPSAFGMANVQSVDQRANGNAPPLEGTYYLFALEEEKDEDPVNSGLLTMLLLGGSFFGANLGWLHTKAQGQGALCLCSLGVGEVLGSAREDYLPFLGVFRL